MLHDSQWHLGGVRRRRTPGGPEHVGNRSRPEPVVEKLQLVRGYEARVLDTAGPRQGRVTSLDAVAAPHQPPRMSPDDAQIIMAVSSDFFTRDLWLYDIVTMQRRQLTRDAGDNHSPLWSRDGRQVAFASNRGGPQRIYGLHVTSENRAETVVFGDARTPGSWAPDGRALFFHETHPGRARDIWLWSADDTESTRLIATDTNERGPAISPNRRWLAYVSDDQAGDQIYIRRYPFEGDPHRVSPAGGAEPVWSRDGSELFYRRARSCTWSL